MVDEGFQRAQKAAEQLERSRDSDRIIISLSHLPLGSHSSSPPPRDRILHISILQATALVGGAAREEREDGGILTGIKTLN
jgi:hypothetical protein